MFDFIYLSLYSIISKDSVLGRNQVAATLHSSMFSIIYLTIFMILTLSVLKISVEGSFLGVLIVCLFGGHFIFNRYYFLREEKQRILMQRFDSTKKWKLKVVGILFIVLSFILFMTSVVVITINR